MANTKMRSRWLTLISLVWLLLWLTLIDPRTAQPIMLLVPFLPIIFIFYQAILWLSNQVIGGKESSSRRKKALSAYASLLLGLLLVLSSLGQLGWRDWLMLLAITVVGLFYIVRLVPAKRN